MESKEYMATVEDSTIYVKNYWTMQDFAITGFWVDNCITTRSGKEIESPAKGVYVKYRIAGLGEGCWMLSMLSRLQDYHDHRTEKFIIW